VRPLYLTRKYKCTVTFTPITLINPRPILSLFYCGINPVRKNIQSIQSRLVISFISSSLFSRGESKGFTRVRNWIWSRVSVLCTASYPMTKVDMWRERRANVALLRRNEIGKNRIFRLK